MKYNTMIIIEGQFYERLNGNIFRVVRDNPIEGLAIIRNVRHTKNGKPYTYQAEVSTRVRSIRRIGTEEILKLLANK